MNGKTYKLQNSDEAMSDAMALFTLPPTDVSCESRETWYYTSKNPIDDNILLYVVDVPPGFMVKTDDIQLCMTGKVVNGDGTDMEIMPDTLWSQDPITEAEKTALLKSDVYPSNLLHSSMFKRVTIRIQDKTIDVCDYPYQAFVDVMLDNSPRGTATREMMQGVFGHGPSEDGRSINKSHTKYDSRARFLSLKSVESREFEMRGPVFADILMQPRPLLGNIRMVFEFERNPSNKILSSLKTDADFKFEVTDAKLHVPLMRLRADINAASEDMLRKNIPALYPYEKCCTKKFYLSSGRFSFDAEALFQDNVPSELTVFMVPSANYNGAYTKEFLRFVNEKVKSVGFKIDNIPTPGPAMKLMSYRDMQLLE